MRSVGRLRGRPQARRYHSNVDRSGAVADESMTSAVDTAHCFCSFGRLRTVSETGWSFSVFRKICVSPSPSTVPGLWKALATPMMRCGASRRTASWVMRRTKASLVGLKFASALGRDKRISPVRPATGLPNRNNRCFFNLGALPFASLGTSSTKRTRSAMPPSPRINAITSASISIR